MLLISFILLIGVRWIFRICIRADNPKAYKQNRDKSFFDRWFFISMHREARDRYVKAEKRKVHFQTSAKAYYITNIVLHIAFVCTIICEIVALFWKPLKNCMLGIYASFCCLILLTFVELAIICFSENRIYYKHKMK